MAFTDHRERKGIGIGSLSTFFVGHSFFQLKPNLFNLILFFIKYWEWAEIPENGSRKIVCSRSRWNYLSLRRFAIGIGSTEIGAEYKRTSYCVGSKGPLYDISFNSQYVKKNTTLDCINLVEAEQNFSEPKFRNFNFNHPACRWRDK